MSNFESEFWTLCFSSAFQCDEGIYIPLEYVVRPKPLLLDFVSYTDNMEKSSPGKVSSFQIEQKIRLFVHCVCISVYAYIF